MVFVPGIPIIALGRDLIWNHQAAILELFWVLEHIPDKTSTQMPCDMTVEGLPDQ
jgi:hypothetical protein